MLMLREMEEPAGSDITLLLDGSADQVVGDPPDTNFELAVRAAGSIADYALRMGRGVSLICHEIERRQVRLTAGRRGTARPARDPGGDPARRHRSRWPWCCAGCWPSGPRHSAPSR